MASATACSRTTPSRSSTTDRAPEGRLVTIGKAYSGLTDTEIADDDRAGSRRTRSRQLGRYHVVEPTVVVEIAFDVIHRSNRHESGFALRFPRIFRLRDDKDAREIDRLSTVERLHERTSGAPTYAVISARGPAERTSPVTTSPAADPTAGGRIAQRRPTTRPTGQTVRSLGRPSSATRA